MIECVGAVRVSSEGAPIVHFGDDRWVCVEDRETADDIGREAAALAERSRDEGVEAMRGTVVGRFTRSIEENMRATYDRPRRKYPRAAALALLAIDVLETMISEVLTIDVAPHASTTPRKKHRDE